MHKIRIGSRESRLAVIQSRLVIDYITENCPGYTPELVTMKTTGDMILDRSLDKVGGKGLFVKELDRCLLDGETDISVHSLKDMPMVVPEEIPIIGYSKREDPRDALILPQGCGEWDMTKPVGCSGKRRIVQLKNLYPDIEIKLIRGNVQTRLKKLDSGEYGAIILAVAGLVRLGLTDRISRIFDAGEIIPAAGQGILAVQGKKGVDYSFLNGFFDREDSICARAERAFVQRLDGGCSSPIAAYAVIEGEKLLLRGLYCREDSFDFVTGSETGGIDRPEELGVALADRLKAGAR
jgi:hydroxymethylbilane synthase